MGKDVTPKVIMGDPAYFNHSTIFNANALNVEFYSQLTPEGKFNMQALLNSIAKSDQQTIFLFQGSAHNPTGINAKTSEEWKIIAKAMKISGATAFFDLPYAGLDISISNDTMPVRIFLSQGIPTAVAFSLAKISGLYSERVAMLLFVTPDKKYALNSTRFLNGIIREINSSPSAWG